MQVKPDYIFSGCAKGADTFGEEVAKDLEIKVKKFPAQWNTLGKKAGILRNEEMMKEADALIVFPGGRGTEDIIKRARQKGIKVYEYYEYF
jgi:hypothetical protein